MSKKRIDTSVSISPLKPSMIQDALGKLMPHLEEAVLGTSLGKLMAPEHLVKAAMNEEVILLAVHTKMEVLGVVVLIIQEFPRGSMCTVYAAGVSREQQGQIDWIRVIRTIKQYVQDYTNCTMISVNGRRGWLRVLRDEGYTEECVTLVKEIER